MEVWGSFNDSLTKIASNSKLRYNPENFKIKFDIVCVLSNMRIILSSWKPLLILKRKIYVDIS